MPDSERQRAGEYHAGRQRVEECAVFTYCESNDRYERSTIDVLQSPQEMSKLEASPDNSREVLNPEFKKKLQVRVEETLRRLVDNKFEDYFEQHVPKAELERASELVFSLIMEGRGDNQALEKIKALSSEIAEDSFRR